MQCKKSGIAFALASVSLALVLAGCSGPFSGESTEPRVDEAEGPYAPDAVPTDEADDAPLVNETVINATNPDDTS